MSLYRCSKEVGTIQVKFIWSLNSSTNFFTTLPIVAWQWKNVFTAWIKKKDWWKNRSRVNCFISAHRVVDQPFRNVFGFDRHNSEAFFLLCCIIKWIRASQIKGNYHNSFNRRLTSFLTEILFLPSKKVKNNGWMHLHNEDLPPADVSQPCQIYYAEYVRWNGHLLVVALHRQLSLIENNLH